METTDQIAQIKACYDKMRKQIVKENGRALQRIDRAEAAALKTFGEGAKSSAPNGATPKVRAARGSRLDPEIQKAVIAVLANDIGYTIKEISKQSNASKSQVRAALEIGMRAGTVGASVGKRNRKYMLISTEANVHGN